MALPVTSKGVADPYAVKDLLNIDEGRPRPTVCSVSMQCVSGAAAWPVIMINDRIYGKVKKEQVMEILAAYKKNKE